MIKLIKRLRVTVQTSTNFLLSGNVRDVMNTLHNLSYIFRGCSISSISQQEFSEAVNAIETVKELKNKAQIRRQL